MNKKPKDNKAGKPEVTATGKPGKMKAGEGIDGPERENLASPKFLSPPESPEKLASPKFHDIPIETFQKALAADLKARIAEGLVNLPAPRTWKEAVTAIDLLRTLEGLKDKALAGHAGFIRPLPTVGRRVIVAEVVGEDPPEFEV